MPAWSTPPYAWPSQSIARRELSELTSSVKAPSGSSEHMLSKVLLTVSPLAANALFCFTNALQLPHCSHMVEVPNGPLKALITLSSYLFEVSPTLV